MRIVPAFAAEGSGSLLQLLAKVQEETGNKEQKKQRKRGSILSFVYLLSKARRDIILMTPYYCVIHLEFAPCMYIYDSVNFPVIGWGRDSNYKLRNLSCRSNDVAAWHPLCNCEKEVRPKNERSKERGPHFPFLSLSYVRFGQWNSKLPDLLD